MSHFDIAFVNKVEVLKSLTNSKLPIPNFKFLLYEFQIMNVSRINNYEEQSDWLNYYLVVILMISTRLTTKSAINLAPFVFTPFLQIY